MKLADRRGNIEECSSGQDRLLEWIYTHETGRFLMKGKMGYGLYEFYSLEQHLKSELRFWILGPPEC